MKLRISNRHATHPTPPAPKATHASFVWISFISFAAVYLGTLPAPPYANHHPPPPQSHSHFLTLLLNFCTAGACPASCGSLISLCRASGFWFRLPHPHRHDDGTGIRRVDLIPFLDLVVGGRSWKLSALRISMYVYEKLRTSSFLRQRAT